MTSDARSEAFPASSGTLRLSAEALDEWRYHVEAVLRGMAHSLNNRAAALSAVIQLAGSEEQPSVVNSVLATELQRVSDLAAAVRSLGAPRGGEMACSPADAASEATELLQLHSDQSDHVTPIDARSASPIRVQRWMFVRALFVLAARAGDTNARVVIADDGDFVAVRVREAAGVAASPFVREMARAMSGQTLDDGAGFRVPALAAVRRREDS